MNINQLEWFCLAYEARSFAKAAEGAFVSRQALGKALAHLEGEVGAQLAERPALRIAIANGVLRSLPAGLLARLEAAFPTLDFFIEKHYFLECFDRLEAGEVDFALCPAPREGSYQRWPVAEERVFVVADNALVSFDPDTCTLEDLESLVFFLPGDRGPNDLGLGRAMAERGLTRRTNTQYTDYDFITEKVIAGQGAALAPESALAPFVEAGLTTFPVPEPTVRWRVELLARQRELTCEPIAPCGAPPCGRTVSVPRHSWAASRSPESRILPGSG